MHSLYTGAGASFVTGDDFIGPSRRRAALLNALIAHWRLEEASGVRADSHAGLDLSDINTVGQAAGKLGNAASFVAGNEEILAAADQGALRMGDIDFTMAAWVRFDVLVGAGLIGKWATGSLEYLIYFDGSNLSFHVSDDGSNNVSVANGAVLSANTWYFFIAWHDAAGDTINLSVDNGAAASAAHSGGVNIGTAALFLGRNEEGLTYLSGRLDSVSIWKRLLTASERTQLYNSGNGLDYPFN